MVLTELNTMYCGQHQLNMDKLKFIRSCAIAKLHFTIDSATVQHCQFIRFFSYFIEIIINVYYRILDAIEPYSIRDILKNVHVKPDIKFVVRPLIKIVC